jgi:hypothetical protein
MRTHIVISDLKDTEKALTCSTIITGYSGTSKSDSLEIPIENWDFEPWSRIRNLTIWRLGNRQLHKFHHPFPSKPA